MNVSPSPVRVFKGMRLGTATPEHNILLVSQQESSTGDPPCLADNAAAPLFDAIAAPDLSTAERSQLVELLTEFHDIFAPPTGPQGCTSTVKHTIPTVGPPVRQPMCRVPEALKDSISCEVNRMLEQNIIRPSSSPWSSPVVMVQKKDGSWRFCIDYRKLNSATHRDAYPLPRIDATLDSLRGCRYFTTLDLAAGYWQVGLEEDDKEKTAFSTLQGHFEFNVMPFGLTNAPATFQRLMECTLAGLTHEQCLIYLDDIIVFSSSFPTHLERLSFYSSTPGKPTVETIKVFFWTNRSAILGTLSVCHWDKTRPQEDRSCILLPNTHQCKAVPGLNQLLQEVYSKLRSYCRTFV